MNYLPAKQIWTHWKKANVRPKECYWQANEAGAEGMDEVQTGSSRNSIQSYSQLNQCSQ